jgi:IclR family transcriptional regulator, acetate operon repressor
MSSETPTTAAASATPESAGTRIQSVERGCRLLLWLAERDQGATAKEAAFANRLALPTTYHLLNTLLEEGFVAKDARRRYVLGPNSAQLGRAYRQRANVPDELFGGLREVAARTGETAYLAAWAPSGMKVLGSVEGSNLVRVAEVVAGPYEAAHARASGKVLLAHAAPAARSSYLRQHPLARQTASTICESDRLERELEAVRSAGYACDREEFAAGVSCVAAPVRTEGVVCAALGLSVPAERFRDSHEEIVRDLLAVTERIEIAPVGPEARTQEVSVR